MLEAIKMEDGQLCALTQMQDASNNILQLGPVLAQH